MHSITVANQQFPSASILGLFAVGTDGEARPSARCGQRLRTVDGLVSVTRNAWAEPFDAFGNFAA